LEDILPLLLITEQRISPMIQQQSDNLDLLGGICPHQSRFPLVVSDVGIASQGEETINDIDKTSS